MKEIFLQSYADAYAVNRLQAARVVGYELWDLPGSLLRAYWIEFREVFMGNKTYTSVGWGQAALAGLPHLLIGLVAALPALFFVLGKSMPTVGSRGGTYFYITDLIFVILMIVLFVAAWRKGWPIWSASLFAYGLIILVVVVAAGFGQFLSGIFGGDLWLGLVFFLLALGALVWMLLFLAFRRHMHALLFSLPLFFLFWQVILEFTSPAARAVAVLLASLIVALIASWVLRQSSLRSGLLVVLAANALVGLLYAGARTYFVNMETYPFLRPGDLAELLDRFVLPFTALSTIQLGPFLLRLLKQQAEKTGQTRSFNLALVGLVLELACVLLAHIWLQQSFDQVRQMGLSKTPGLVAAWVSYFGAVVFLVGAVRIMISAHRQRSQPSTLWMAAVVTLLVLLPPLAALALEFGYHIPVEMPYAMAWLQQQPVWLVYLLAGVWVFSAGWVTVKFLEPISEPAYSSPTK